MKDNTLKELQTVCVSVVIICLCETAALFFSNSFPPVISLAIIRSLQIVFLLIFLYFTSDGLEFAGLLKSQWYHGLKTGLIWSFLFGIIVILAAWFIFHFAGINPLLLLNLNPFRGNPIIFFLTGTVIGPIAEEIFFRGILYSFLRKSGIIVAVVTTTLIFALFHVSNGSFPVVQIVGGLIFAISFEYSKSLITPIVIHVLGNLAIFSIYFIFS